MTNTAATSTVTPSTALDPRVGVTFARRERGVTHWIEGDYPEDARPDDLFAAFEAAGWVVDPLMEGVPAYEPMDFDFSLPVGQQGTQRGYKIKQFSLSKRGSALFVGWTPAEKTSNLREARTLMRRFGLTRVPVWTKTLADML